MVSGAGKVGAFRPVAALMGSKQSCRSFRTDAYDSFASFFSPDF